MNNLDDFLNIGIGLIFSYGPFLAAAILGIALPSIVVILSSATKKYPDHLKLTAMFGAIIIGSALAVAFSGRTIFSEAELAARPALLANAPAGQGNYWFSRIAHLILLSVAITEIFNWVMRQRKMGEGQFSLWLAMIFYFVLSVLVSGLFGHFRDVEVKVLYAPIVFTAALLLSSSDFKKTLNALRWILLVPLVGSLIGIFLSPHLVMETGYKGIIPGLTIRLAGLAEHANSLGIVAAIGILFEFSRYVSARPNIFFVAIAGANLILSQSKTAWIVVVLGFLLIGINKFKEKLSLTKSSNAILGFASATFLFGAAAIFVIILKISKFQSYLDADRTGLTTFTGRTKIWSVTWDEFVINPISGYGPSIWDLQYRIQHGMTYVGQAHNQYIQTLGQAGLIGIISLSVYIYMLLRKSYKGWEKTQGFAFVIVLVLLVRGFSESPMRFIGIMDFDSFLHMLAFVLVAVTIYQKKNTQNTSLENK